MTPAAIINEATADGVQLLLYPNGLVKVTGKLGAVNRWRLLIAQNKAGIVGLLKPVTVTDTRVPASEIKVTSCWWRFHYANRDPKEASYSPAATYAEAMAGEPDAISGEPFEPILRQPHAPLSQEEETVLLDWLERIDEKDEVLISAMLRQCHTDQDARDFFLGLAEQ